MAITPIDIVRGIYSGTPQERAARLTEAVKPDVVWQESEGYLYGGRYQGLEDVFQSVFLPQATEWEGFGNEAEHFVADGDSVIVLGFYHGTHLDTRKSFRARFAHHWRFEEGRIAEFVQYVDSHTVWKAAQAFPNGKT